MAATLKEPLKQEVGRGVQEGLLTVWGADVLGRADPCRAFNFLARGERIFFKQDALRKGEKKRHL